MSDAGETGDRAVGRVSGTDDVSDDSVSVLGEAVAALPAEADELELLEFLAADLDPVPADPRFERALREQLWEMVKTGRLPRPPQH